MSYHGRLGECHYIYMIKETNELALNVSLVVSIMIHYNWHCLSMSCRIKYTKAMKKDITSSFPHRSEHWVKINSTILENWKHFFPSSLKAHFRGKCTILPALKFHTYFKTSLVIRFTYIENITTTQEGSWIIPFSLGSGIQFPFSNTNK